MFEGCYVAIVTPFKEEKIDEEGLRKNLKFLKDAGVAGIVPCGTTGETPTLSNEEWKNVIKITVEECGDKMQIIGGAGTNSTKKTIENIKTLQKIGVDAVLVVTPYYNKPTQNGLFHHFIEIGKVGVPVVAYNVPGRTGSNLLPETLARIVEKSESLVAVKEASGSLDAVSKISQLIGSRIDILSGDDSLTLPMLSVGAKGVISVAGNIVPKDLVDMINYYFDGKFEEAKRIHLKLFPLVKMLFIETNPIPVKKAMEIIGSPAGKPRLPLVEMDEKNVQLLEAEIKKLGLL